MTNFTDLVIQKFHVKARVNLNVVYQLSKFTVFEVRVLPYTFDLGVDESFSKINKGYCSG